MKKPGYSAALLSMSAFALVTMSSQAHADASSQAEIAALKAQLKEMAAQQQKAAAMIEKLAAKVDTLQKQNSVQASKVSDIQKQQVTLAAQPEKLARVEPAAGNNSRNGGAYLGVLGGWGKAESATAHQLGTVYFYEVNGGPQSINGTGKLKSSGTGVIGVQAGYELSHNSTVRPAVEVEALYMPRTRQHGDLAHQDARTEEHLFSNSLPTDTSVVLMNAVVGFETPYENITPYIGGGVGAAYISVDGASSAQLNPAEPGINHFSAASSSSALAAAAQLKAGVHMDLTDSTYLFGEYRALYIGAHDQTFGGTTDASHVPTSPWTVKYDGTFYNLATAGLGMRF